MDSQLLISNELKKLNEILAECRRVEETIGSKGWQEIVEPLIDKMIGDVLGAKVKGRWNGGLLDKARKEEKREYYIGYKQALIDLHTRVYAYVNSIKTYEDRRDKLLKDQQDIKYSQPMVDDTRYGRDLETQGE